MSLAENMHMVLNWFKIGKKFKGKDLLKRLLERLKQL